MNSQDQRAGADEHRRMLAGRYLLGERLGRGGMGTVWRARDEMLDREVAVKELTINHLPDDELEILQSRMKREAQAAARIKHPGVITIHDVLEQDGRPWIVMELVDGRSLADVIRQDGPLLPREAAEIGLQVLAALHRGHQLGVLHRDVKPANVLLEHGTGRVVLLDFGIAKFEGASELTRPGDLVGSPDYLAPERAQGGILGPASDLWGLGATLYAAVEGESPFRRESPINTLAAVVEEPMPEPRRAGALGPVLAALLAKDPAERPGADEALRMLGEVSAGHTIGIARPGAQRGEPTRSVPVADRTRPVSDPQPAPGTAPGTVVAPAARGGRRRGLMIAAAVLAVLAVTGVAAGLAQRQFGGAGTTGGRGGQGGQAGRGGQGALPSTTSDPASDPASGTASGTPTGEPGEPLPSGYRWQRDPAGFWFPLPADGTWTRSTDDRNQIYYSPDGRKRYLQFSVTVGMAQTPLQHFEAMEATVGRNKDYRRLMMVDTRIDGHPAAEWEFSYTGKDGVVRQAKEAEFVNGDGTSYAIYISGEQGPDVQQNENLFDEVLNEFTPSR